MNRKCVLILNAPRSGSSFLTNVVKDLGYYTTDHVVPPNKFNEKGYFEDYKLQSFNNRVMKDYGFSVWHFCCLDNKQIKSLLEYKDELVSYLKSEYDHVHRFVLKDPRLIILIKLYLYSLKNMNIDPLIITLYRSKESTAKSIMNYIQTDESRYNSTVRLVEFYHKQLKTVDKEFNTLSIHFEEILKDPSILKKIASFIGCDFNKKVLKLLNRKLVHYS